MFVRRILRITVDGTGEENAGVGGKFEGLRTIVRVEKAGSPYAGTAHVMLFGLSLDHLNDISTRAMLYRPSLDFNVQIDAGDAVNGMHMIFKGTIQQAWADFSSMPEVVLHITAHGSTAPAQVGPAEPTSATGGVQVAPLIQKLAGVGKLGFMNFGVSSRLHNIYTWGSPWKQIREIAQAANFNAFVDDQVCKIWQKGKPTSGSLLVSRETGMRDYPTFIQNGIQVKVEYSRPIDYASTITVKSDLKNANGTWYITKLDYDLAAELPGGPWYVIIDAQASNSQTRFYNT